MVNEWKLTNVFFLFFLLFFMKNKTRLTEGDHMAKDIQLKEIFGVIKKRISEETGNILRNLKMLVDSVPVYRLDFQNNKTFWELIT